MVPCLFRITDIVQAEPLKAHNKLRQARMNFPALGCNLTSS